MRLYHAVHASLLDVLASWRIQGTLCERTDKPGLASAPFLCFQRRSPGDLLIGTAKVAGSAQRRCRGAVLQHGSVLVSRSSAAPELPGIVEASGMSVEIDEIMRVWMNDLPGRLGLLWENGPLRDGEIERTEELVRTKYGTAGWTDARRK